MAGWWWMVSVAGLVVAGAAGGAWWWQRQRAPAAERAVPIAAPALALRAPDFAAALSIPVDEPQVWGARDPLTLTLRNEGAAGQLTVASEGGSSRAHLEAGERVVVPLAFAMEGEHVVEARREDAPDMAPLRVPVRVVDYRKEIAREFDLLLARAQRLDPTLTRESTPREIAWALCARIGKRAERHLNEVTLLVETTNYSPADVSREHYLRFVRAARALDPLLAPAPEA